jgi:transcriptional regulator/uncharacterized protein DUF262
MFTCYDACRFTSVVYSCEISEGEAPRMPYQAPITVKTALDRIRKHDYVLPAIQREFVWKPEQIYKLFDSLLQGFPVGLFLFWKIEPETSRNFEFFDFAREYHQRDNPHCPPLGKVPDGTVTAILDNHLLPLTPQEFSLLEYLCRNEGRVVTRTIILDHVWKMRIDPATNVVDVHIYPLRSKVDHDTPRPLIHTIRGVGYVLKHA